MENAPIGTVIATVSGVADSLVEGVGTVTISVIAPEGYALLFSISNPSGALSTTSSLDLLRVPSFVIAVSVRTMYGRVGAPGNITIGEMGLLASVLAHV